MRALGLEARAAQLRYNRRHFLSRCKPVVVREIVHVVKPRRKILLARKQPKHFRYMPFLRITPFFVERGERTQKLLVAIRVKPQRPAVKQAAAALALRFFSFKTTEATAAV